MEIVTMEDCTLVISAGWKLVFMGVSAFASILTLTLFVVPLRRMQLARRHYIEQQRKESEDNMNMKDTETKNATAGQQEDRLDSAFSKVCKNFQPQSI